MSKHHQLALPPAEVKPVDYRSASALTQSEKNASADVVLALKAVDLKLTAAASMMGRDLGQLSRQLAGDGHLSYRRLARLPKHFREQLIRIRGERLGLFVCRAAQDRVSLAFISRNCWTS